jgi:hypothetical protein
MSQERGEPSHCKYDLERGEVGVRAATGGVAQAGIPGLAARPSGRPAPRRHPLDARVSLRSLQSAIYYFFQSIDNVQDSGNPGALVCNQHIYSHLAGKIRIKSP